MSEDIDALYSKAEKRLKDEHDRAVEKIREELKAVKRKALSK
jgi:hypothetical protein